MVQVKGIYIEVTAKNVAKIEVTVENYERRSHFVNTNYSQAQCYPILQQQKIKKNVTKMEVT